MGEALALIPTPAGAAILIGVCVALVWHVHAQTKQVIHAGSLGFTRLIGGSHGIF